MCVCISENSISGGKRLTEKRKKTLAKLACKLKKLLANSKIHSHLASWRVVISTPAMAKHLWSHVKEIGRKK
jgi:hypothetical protein